MNRRRKNLLDLSIQRLRLANDIVPMTTDSTGVSLQLQELLSNLESIFKERSDCGGLLLARFYLDSMINAGDAANLKAVLHLTPSAPTRSPKTPILSGHPYILGTVFTLLTASSLIP